MMMMILDDNVCFRDAQENNMFKNDEIETLNGFANICAIYPPYGTQLSLHNNCCFLTLYIQFETIFGANNKIKTIKAHRK